MKITMKDGRPGTLINKGDTTATVYLEHYNGIPGGTETVLLTDIADETETPAPTDTAEGTAGNTGINTDTGQGKPAAKKKTAKKKTAKKKAAKKAVKKETPAPPVTEPEEK